MRSLRLTGRFWVAAVGIVVVVLFGFLGPVIFSGHQLGVAVGGLFDPPSSAAWLGTDYLGHDIFTNLIYGTRTSLIIGLVAGAVTTVIGVILGVVAGYRGGFAEEALMGVTNVVLAIPAIVVLILLSVSLPTRGALTLAIVIGVTSWPWTARAVRAQASSVRTREHIDIAKLSGARTASIMAFDVLPYMLSYIVMAFVLQVSSAILAEAGLSLLGLGPSQGQSLGIMLHWALAWEAVRNGAWPAFVAPTVVLTLIGFSLLLLQSSMDELFNPKLRRKKVRRSERPAPVKVGQAAVVDVDRVVPQ